MFWKDFVQSQMVKIEELGAFWRMFGCLGKISCTPELELMGEIESRVE